MYSSVRALFVCGLSCLPLCLLPISAVHVGAGADTKGQILINPGFEAPYNPLSPSPGKSQISGAIAKGWRDNSAWANVTVEYSQEINDVKSGHFAQGITVQAVRSGGVQFIQPFTTDSKHTYAASLWVKGLNGALVSAAVRQSGAPYATYGSQQIVLNGKWQELRFEATASEKTAGLFIIFPPTGSKLLIGQASLVDTNAAVKTGY